MRSVRLAVFVTLLTVACGHAGDGARDGGAPAVAASERVPGPLDDLDIRLELSTSEVPSGGELQTTRIVENRSGRTITDGQCYIAAGRYGIASDLDRPSELWRQPVIECNGPFEMADGYAARIAGPTFPAYDRQGHPLEPGDYFVVLQIEGRSDPLAYPITVTP